MALSNPPEMWLVGRTHTLKRNGLDYKAAIHQAYLDWQEQERLSLEAQRLKCGHTMADWIESGMGACGACNRGK